MHNETIYDNDNAINWDEETDVVVIGSDLQVLPLQSKRDLQEQMS
ncbi:hypothetical protein [Haloplasma contractile]|nr:hypothetical protein [Haloplasma contractile]